MLVTHPIYGPGQVVQAAAGCFAYVRFLRPTNVSSVLGPNTLAVSLKVCS